MNGIEMDTAYYCIMNYELYNCRIDSFNQIIGKFETSE